MLPGLRGVAHGGLFSVSDDGQANQLLILIDLVLLRRFAAQIAEQVQVRVAALPVHQPVHAAHGPQHRVELLAREPVALHVDELIFDPPLLEPALGLFGIKALGFAEDLDVNKYITVDIFCVDYLKPSYVKNIERNNKLTRLLSISKVNWAEKRYLIRAYKLSNGIVKYVKIISLYCLHLLRLIFSEKGIERFIYRMAVDTTNTSKRMGVVIVNDRPFSFSSDFMLNKVTFDKLKVLIPSNYDEILTKSYGDYMTPPPEDQRHGIDRFEVILEVEEHQ